MAYKVVITSPAQHRLDMYVGYTFIRLIKYSDLMPVPDSKTKTHLSTLTDIKLPHKR